MDAQVPQWPSISAGFGWLFSQMWNLQIQRAGCIPNVASSISYFHFLPPFSFTCLEHDFYLHIFLFCHFFSPFLINTHVGKQISHYSQIIMFLKSIYKHSWTQFQLGSVIINDEILSSVLCGQSLNQSTQRSTIWLGL